LQELAQLALEGMEWPALPEEPVVAPTLGRGGAGHLVLCGVGDEVPPAPWRMERAVAAAARVARRRRWGGLVIELPGWRSAADEARSAILGATMGASSPEFGKAATPPFRQLDLHLAVRDGGGNVRVACEMAEREAEVWAEVHRLANLDAATATPQFLAREARRLARRWGVRCRVHDARALEQMGCRALLAVGRGSRHPPCLIELEHAGARGRPVALAGKTITFDSGGLSLKPWKGMSLMRYDKSGGMAVLAAVLTAAVRRLPLRVIGLLPVAENMPDGGALRPGDILRTRAGVTVEVISTDAEGRLILADALSLAVERRPVAIVDVATLTGAALVALGRHAAAILGNDDRLIASLRRCGEAVGERVWPLPLWPEYDTQLRSDFADLANSGEGGAGTILGAAFLKRFVPADIPWAHLDIAATGKVDTAAPHRGPGATLFGARLLSDWLALGAPLA